MPTTIIMLFHQISIYRIHFKMQFEEQDRLCKLLFLLLNSQITIRAPIVIVIRLFHRS